MLTVAQDKVEMYSWWIGFDEYYIYSVSQHPLHSTTIMIVIILSITETN